MSKTLRTYVPSPSNPGYLPYLYSHLAFSVPSITNILSTALAAVQTRSSTSTPASILFLSEPAAVVIISRLPLFLSFIPPAFLCLKEARAHSISLIDGRASPSVRLDFTVRPS